MGYSDVVQKRELKKILSTLKIAKEKNLIIERHENNPYLLKSYNGSNTSISDKWNVKIYDYS